MKLASGHEMPLCKSGKEADTAEAKYWVKKCYLFNHHYVNKSVLFFFNGSKQQTCRAKKKLLVVTDQVKGT